jgi:hypothetical protein
MMCRTVDYGTTSNNRVNPAATSNMNDAIEEARPEILDGDQAKKIRQM